MPNAPRTPQAQPPPQPEPRWAQASKDSTAHKPGLWRMRAEHKLPNAQVLLQNFYPNRFVFSKNKIVASIIILFVMIYDIEGLLIY